MSVNPNLATLMRVIEDHKDKMPEGEYLEAMNALGALHRAAAAAPLLPLLPLLPLAAQIAAVPPNPSLAVAVPVWSLFRGKDDYELWSRVTRVLSHIDPNSWLSMSQEEQNELNRESTRKIAKNQERVYRNPTPTCCPFVARHAVGDWRTNETDSWTCVCGYSGKIKHWQKHERSARHQEWAQHRIVPEKVVTTMQKQIQKDEQGTVMKCMRPISNGFRYFLIRQERNEWTHPELFPANTRRNDGQEWFVLQRHVREMFETHQNFNWGVDDRIEMFV
jgi:hypothetical protein